MYNRVHDIKMVIRRLCYENGMIIRAERTEMLEVLEMRRIWEYVPMGIRDKVGIFSIT